MPDRPALPSRLPPEILPTGSRSHRRIRRYLVATLGLVLLCGFLLCKYPILLSSPHAELATEKVQYERLKPTLVVQGDVGSAENTDIICRVRAFGSASALGTPIRWIVEDGTTVKEGQLLVELDDSGLRENLDIRKVPLEMAKADWTQAEENHRIVASQNQGDIQAAEVAARLAELDLEKYTQGDYVQERDDLRSRLTQGESDLDMCRDRAAWAEQMAKKGFLGAGQVRSEHFRMDSAQGALNNLREQYRVLEKYTKRRVAKGLETDLQEARFKLKQLRLRARAKDAQTDADRLFKLRIYQRRLTRYREIEDEIKKCTIVAPHDGLVVYNVPEPLRAGLGAQTSTIAQGEPVRLGQKIMSLPNLAKMQVVVRVHEAAIAHVRGEERQPTYFGDRLQAGLLIVPDPFVRLTNVLAYVSLQEHFHDLEQKTTFPGQATLIKIDAFPNRTFRGHVQQVSPVISQLDSPLRDVRIYLTQILIDEPVEGLRPDMSAQVTIFVNEPPTPVLAVPTDAIVHDPEQGNHCSCFVMTQDGPEERDVVLGLPAEPMVEIHSGLHAGDEIVLHPQALLKERNKPHVSEGESLGGAN